MKALMLREYGQLEVVDAPAPIPAPDEVLVHVKACGICGSDVHGYDGSSGRRIPPIVMGHEAAGTVEAMGSEVSGIREGDRVTLDSTIYCGSCVYCHRGEVNQSKASFGRVHARISPRGSFCRIRRRTPAHHAPFA
jgi:L-iditol 2-dehydrogenase